MKIENQVINLLQAKKLKELGVEQNSFFWWIKEDEHHYSLRHYGLTANRKGFSAFSVAELGEMLPDYYVSWRFPVHTNGPLKWVATVICSPKPPGVDDIHTASEFDRFGDTQAEALATLLIALLETEVITPSEINNRLSK